MLRAEIGKGGAQSASIVSLEKWLCVESTTGGRWSFLDDAGAMRIVEAGVDSEEPSADRVAITAEASSCTGLAMSSADAQFKPLVPRHAPLVTNSSPPLVSGMHDAFRKDDEP